MKTGRGKLVDVAFGFGHRTANGIETPLEVAPGVILEPLTSVDAKVLRGACRMRLARRHEPRDAYALIVDATSEGAPESNEALWRALNCSRLVWYSQMAQEYIAQVSVDASGSFSEDDVTPAEVMPQVLRAYWPHFTEPEFPTVQDATAMRTVMRSQASSRGRGGRVGTALRRFVDASYLFQVDLRMKVLTSVLETLVNTTKGQAKEQFVSRVAGITRLCFGHRRYGRSWARRVYKMRNTLAHGRRLLHHRRGYAPEAFELAYKKFTAEIEHVIRHVLRTAHTKREVLEILQSPGKVAAKWPVSRPPKKHPKRFNCWCGKQYVCT